MTNEERQLLLQVICARLPYGVYAKVDGIQIPIKIRRIEVDDIDGVLVDFDYKTNNLPVQVYLSEVKPYLRPLSTMTEEERREMGEAIFKDRIEPYGEISKSGVDNLLLCSVKESNNIQDWLNQNGFDHRGLIEMGLALEATKDMYK